MVVRCRSPCTGSPEGEMFAPRTPGTPPNKRRKEEKRKEGNKQNLTKAQRRRGELKCLTGLTVGGESRPDHQGEWRDGDR